MFFKESILPFLRVFLNFINGLPQLLTYPPFIGFFIVILIIISIQYKRLGKMEKHLYGRTIYPLSTRLISSLKYGVLGGLLISLVFIVLGVALNNAGINYVWIVAISLMVFVNPRFMCFSYAGGIVSVVYLLRYSLIKLFEVVHMPAVIISFLQRMNVDIPTLMVLVAALHLVESFLIRVHAHKHPVPVSIKRPDGKMVGGFHLQCFWPVPLLVLVVVYMAAGLPGDVVEMPEWWPLLKPEGIDLNNPHIMFSMLPVVAGLGYGELAMSANPKKKTRHTSQLLATYSVLLLALALLASRYSIFMWIAALFAPLAHEALVYFSNWNEQRREPLYVAPTIGVMILDVLSKSPAEKGGLCQGDIIETVNGQIVENISSLKHLVEEHAPFVLFNVRRREGHQQSIQVTVNPNTLYLGVIPVPDSTTEEYVKNQFKSPLGWLHRLVQK